MRSFKRRCCVELFEIICAEQVASNENVPRLFANVEFMEAIEFMEVGL